MLLLTVLDPEDHCEGVTSPSLFATVIPPAFGGKLQKIKDNDHSLEFPLRLMSKDMNLVMEAAETSGADLPAARMAQSVLASNLSQMVIRTCLQ
jgi:3-hydroxyisobutyrate dehydrogenase-like beta-hydroxyacid dehydrogenase